MSGNFFAALDDSGDESSPPQKKTVTQTKAKSNTSASASSVKKNERRNNDRNTKGGRGRPPARDGKRTYDRRSGTGRGKEIKKGGGGARNWGSDKGDARKAEGALDEDNVPAPEGEEAAPATEREEEVAKEPEEPEVVTKTYDEHMAEKLKAKENNPLFQPKEVKEVTNEFSGIKIKKAVEEDFLVMGEGKALRKKGSGKKSIGEDEKVQLSFRVGSRPGGEGRRDGGDRDRRGGRGRGGGRRGGRGGRGRGGGGGRGGAATNALDPSAFPSLS